MAVVLLTLAASGCTSEGDTHAEEGLCDATPASAEGKALRQLLGADDLKTTIDNEYDDLVESMQEWLRPGGPEKSALPLQVCSFAPKSTVGAQRLSLDFTWVPRDASAVKARELPGPLSHYNVNGAIGEANDIISRLTVPCRLPGDFKEPSKRVLLKGETSNTLLMGTKVEQKTVDRQVGFLYLMTRRVSDALGCTNDPLAKAPVVKPYGSASEAAAAQAK
ncbi:hypothetical protein [Streptomyces sp. NPDC056192]|uniref:hypothetical protein n=1 Tax=unclassified Streptomyces TaxID=2593676 RepID=UPI0035E1FBEF